MIWNGNGHLLCYLLFWYIQNIKLLFRLQFKVKLFCAVTEKIKTTVQWEQAEGKEKEDGIRVILNHFKIVKQVTWHGKGDYFATVMPDGQNRSVLINQLSKRRSQLPFRRPKGMIQCVLFHPIRPFLFVAVSWLTFQIINFNKIFPIKKLFLTLLNLINYFKLILIV